VHVRASVYGFNLKSPHEMIRPKPRLSSRPGLLRNALFPAVLHRAQALELCQILSVLYQRVYSFSCCCDAVYVHSETGSFHNA
jgi:hypothetical protein